MNIEAPVIADLAVICIVVGALGFSLFGGGLLLGYIIGRLA